MLIELKRILIVLVCISGVLVALLMIGFNDVIVFDPLLDEMRCQERISEQVGVEPTEGFHVLCFSRRDSVAYEVQSFAQTGAPSHVFQIEMHSQLKGPREAVALELMSQLEKSWPALRKTPDLALFAHDGTQLPLGLPHPHTLRSRVLLSSADLKSHIR